MTTPRREVLKAAAATALSAAFSGPAFAQPSRPYRVGVVGAGWFGKLDLWSLMQVAPVEVVALCDVDQRMLEDARDRVRARPDSVLAPRRRPAIYRDYRQMLRNHQFDIVIVATPDHWHTLPAIAALNAGAHVYIEKPISVDVREGEALVAAARRNNRIVQVGTQRRTSPFLVEAKQRVLDAGLIGAVRHVEVYCYYQQRPVQFSPVQAPPPGMDWDFYCGPAPLIGFRPEMHPRDWRAFSAFGNGYMGDVGVHFIDACRWMLGLGHPSRISSEGGVYVATQSPSDVPDTQSATFAFGNDTMMTWTNRHWGRAVEPREAWGAHLHGERGTLRIYNLGYEWQPLEGEGFAGSMPSEIDQFPHDRQTYAENWEWPLAAITRHHMRDFLAAIAANRPPTSDIEEGHISTACCVLANTAMDLKRTLHWDGHNVVGDDEANGRLMRPYRAPWVHPASA